MSNRYAGISTKVRGRSGDMDRTGASREGARVESLVVGMSGRRWARKLGASRFVPGHGGGAQRRRGDTRPHRSARAAGRGRTRGRGDAGATGCRPPEDRDGGAERHGPAGLLHQLSPSRTVLPCDSHHRQTTERPGGRRRGRLSAERRKPPPAEPGPPRPASTRRAGTCAPCTPNGTAAAGRRGAATRTTQTRKAGLWTSCRDGVRQLPCRRR